MPPRYAYWTILIDQKPTAFRARDKEELLPTFHQLQRKNSDVVMKWFARGRLWDTPEQAQWAQRNMQRPLEKRSRDWRPGGDHKDPRDRFKKRSGNPSGSRVSGSAERDGPKAPASGAGAPREFKNPRVPDRRGPGATGGSWTARKFGSGPGDPRARPGKPKKDRG
jgi:hypothetical protein